MPFSRAAVAGWVAGSMVLAGYFMRRELEPDESSVSTWLPWISLVLISLGMGALFLDLEHKLYVWRLYLTFQPASPMSWGRISVTSTRERSSRTRSAQARRPP